jgi:hypothetical protein
MLHNMTSEKTQAGYLVDECYQTFVIALVEHHSSLKAVNWQIVYLVDQILVQFKYSPDYSQLLDAYPQKNPVALWHLSRVFVDHALKLFIT